MKKLDCTKLIDHDIDYDDPSVLFDSLFGTHLLKNVLKWEIQSVLVINIHWLVYHFNDW